MEKNKWSYQQFDPVSRRFVPVPEEKEAYGKVTVFGVPDGYEAPILAMFAERDARRARCRIVAFQ